MNPIRLSLNLQDARPEGIGRREKSWTSDPLVPNYATKKSKSFIWCRLGTKSRSFLSLSCTEVVPNFFLLISELVSNSSIGLPSGSSTPESLARRIGTTRIKRRSFIRDRSRVALAMAKVRSRLGWV